MKIKPIIMNHIETSHTLFEVSFNLDYNITFIIGDSGTGKTAVFSFIKELSTEDKRIKCFNYLDIKKNYKNSIKKSKDNLFVIDNADILLNDKMREYIAKDTNNQYIIIGRNPTGLMITRDNIYEIMSEKVGEKIRFSLSKM